MEMSELIKTIRSQLGMTQKDFGKAIHVAYATVNRWENNRTMPNDIALAVIADYCEKQGIDRALIDAIQKIRGGSE